MNWTVFARNNRHCCALNQASKVWKSINHSNDETSYFIMLEIAQDYISPDKT
jgi:hypothetical protein